MRIQKVCVCNFRSILNETVELGNLTTLVGPNGSGKSALIRALEVFYTIGAKLSDEDFYDRDTNHLIEVTITYDDLEVAALDEFKAYIQGTTLSVTKRIQFPGGRNNERYYGTRLAFPRFQELRALDKAADRIKAYKELGSSPDFKDLPAGLKSDRDVLAALAEWEQKHSEQLEPCQDDGQFFGFKEVGTGKLDKYTRFILIPAVRDAAVEAAEGKGNILTELLDLVVKQVLNQRADIKEFRRKVSEEYQKLMAPESLTELPELSKQLTDTLVQYVPDAGVNLQWQKSGEFQVPLPAAVARLIEDQFEGDVSRKGHGLQRAFIMTLLQHLEVARSLSTQEIPGAEKEGGRAKPSLQTPDLLLTIEEPELYQHPSRSRHLAQVFCKLTESVPGDAPGRIQILHSTHSPHFVDIQRFENIRLFRKYPGGTGKPKITRVQRIDGQKVAAELETAVSGRCVGEFTVQTLVPRLTPIMTPWVTEGFFARGIVLVEGLDDRAALIAAAMASGIQDLDGMGIAILPVMGKNNLDRPYLIFKAFGIPIYLVFDGDKDKGKDAKTNRTLLALVGAMPEDFPSTRVMPNGSCFESCLEQTLRGELGTTKYDAELRLVAGQYGYSDTSDAQKNPHVLAKVMKSLAGRGSTSTTLTKIVDQIMTLLGDPRPDTYDSPGASGRREDPARGREAGK